jgi:hypothetical protein
MLKIGIWRAEPTLIYLYHLNHADFVAKNPYGYVAKRCPK